ncbi:MAG: hypothetical protein JXB18_09005, partial [Sedimentisphaerales bacterium]|nr:hypothetical protein [Sedimentisphaerales bacterium]
MGEEARILKTNGQRTGYHGGLFKLVHRGEIVLRNIIIVLGVIAGLSVVYYCVQEKAFFVHANPQIQISFN